MGGKRPGGPIRVAYFPMHPSDDRATDTFCTLPANRLPAGEFEGTVFAPSSPSLRRRMYRGKRMGWQVSALLYWYLIVLPRRIVQIVSASRYDVIFVQRSMFRWSSPPVLEWITSKVLRKPLVYHLDDGIWVEARRRWSELRCSMATTVVTGNDLVADFVTCSGGSVSRIEYSIDVTAYPVKVHQDTSPVVIGYTGIDPRHHLEPMSRAIEDVCRATGARLGIVGGMSRPELGGLDRYLDWTAWDENDQYSWVRKFDIGVMPLTDTELHRLKEPMKVKEYMAAGLPQVVSPVGHNLNVITDGEEGFFADGPDQWRERLTELVNDPALRSQMGARGRQLVLEKYDLPRLLDELAALFRSL